MSTARFIIFVMLLGGCLSGCAQQRTESLASAQSPPPTTKSLSMTAAKTPLSPFIRRIFEDRRGRIWFATHHNGICYRVGDKFTHITAKDGPWEVTKPR